MTWVYTQNVTCPVCGAETAHPDLGIHTNQRDFDCVRCGGYSYLLGFADDDEVTCPEVPGDPLGRSQRELGAAGRVRMMLVRKDAALLFTHFSI